MALLLPSKAINATEILTAKKRRTPKEGAFAKIGFIELTSKNEKDTRKIENGHTLLSISIFT
ncbi:hypothetical protein AM305_07498 [Actinobacillus minor NM305]|uniref:Uncharacterized protein n=1 Tax=Actinobacillus minor NM305 TaxID=637911 RepID=C5S0S4_9PAST|nr:hypothetical protein AM305_07498 [Actinobacillus minor NM305]